MVDVTFEADKTVLQNDDDIVLKFFTNSDLINGTYLVSIRQKEQALYSQIVNLKNDKKYQLTIPSDSIDLPNGGVLTAELE